MSLCPDRAWHLKAGFRSSTFLERHVALGQREELLAFRGQQPELHDGRVRAKVPAKFGGTQSAIRNGKEQNILTGNNSIRTCLWFDGKGLEAAKFHVSPIPRNELHTPGTGDNEPLLVSFTLGGVPCQILNGGPHHQWNPACSIAVATPDQDETDRIWDALAADDGVAGRYGWLVDRGGVSRQVYPQALPQMLGADDGEAAARAQAPMLGMSKINIAAMRSACEGNWKGTPALG